MLCSDSDEIANAISYLAIGIKKLKLFIMFTFILIYPLKGRKKTIMSLFVAKHLIASSDYVPIRYAIHYSDRYGRY